MGETAQTTADYLPSPLPIPLSPPPLFPTPPSPPSTPLLHPLAPLLYLHPLTLLLLPLSQHHLLHLPSPLGFFTTSKHYTHTHTHSLSHLPFTFPLPFLLYTPLSTSLPHFTRPAIPPFLTNLLPLIHSLLYILSFFAYAYGTVSFAYLSDHISVNLRQALLHLQDKFLPPSAPPSTTFHSSFLHLISFPTLLAQSYLPTQVIVSVTVRLRQTLLHSQDQFLPPSKALSLITSTPCPSLPTLMAQSHLPTQVIISFS